VVAEEYNLIDIISVNLLCTSNIVISLIFPISCHMLMKYLVYIYFLPYFIGSVTYAFMLAYKAGKKPKSVEKPEKPLPGLAEYGRAIPLCSAASSERPLFALLLSYYCVFLPF